MYKSHQGFALVIVIWVLTLLSLMAGSFALSMRRENSVALALKNNAQAAALTESGLNLAGYMLEQGTPETRWLADGSIYQIQRHDGSEVRIKIISEAGKMDINASDESKLSALIKTVTADLWEEQELLNRILDWRDEDNDTRPHGAERKQYQSAGLSYVPANKPFQTLDELQLVLGMDEDRFLKLQPFLTVYSGQAEVSLEEASPAMLKILEQDAKTMQVHDLNLEKNLAAKSGETGNDQNNPQAINNQNRTYTIIVEVAMDDATSASLEAVIKMQSDDPARPGRQVLDWKQNQLMESLFTDDTESQLIAIQDEFTSDN